MSSSAPAGRSFSPGGAVAGIIFLVLGVLFFLDAVDVVTLRLDVLLPVALIALGFALVLGAIWPRDRRAG